MSHSDAVHYLEHAGFHYKPAESPDLWTFLESHFAGPRPVGSKFTAMPSAFVAELIGLGEEALLEAMVAHHRKTGSLGRFTRVIDLPYIVGTDAAVPLAEADSAQVLRLIEQPGTPAERIVRLVPTAADDIPCTSHMTVTGGLYADGHTAGYYDLRPGEHCENGDTLPAGFAFLATEAEISSLAREMEAKIEDITLVTRRECEEMLGKVKRMLG